MIDHMRLLLGTAAQRSLFMERFKPLPARIGIFWHLDQLEGVSQETHRLILFDGWRAEAPRGMLYQLERLESRQPFLVEYVGEAELLGGPIARRHILLAKYDKMAESSGISYLSQAFPRAWINSLSEADSRLLIEAIEERKKLKNNPLNNPGA